MIIQAGWYKLVIISPWKGVWSFIWKKMNTLHPMMLCAKFGWNWFSDSLEEDENVKSMNSQTDKKQSEKPTWASAQVSLKRENISSNLDNTASSGKSST